MLFLLERLNNFYKKILLDRKIVKISRNPKIPFYLVVYSKMIPRIEVVRQFQLVETNIPITEENGFAIYLIVSYNPKYKDNLKELSFFKELIEVDSKGGKYLFLLENNFEELSRLLYYLNENVFELKKGDNYQMSIKLFS